MIAYELVRGLAYRQIRHEDMHWYTTTLPAALTGVIVAVVMLLPVQMKLLGSDGVLASTLSLISTLPGFYFAGLAAVATFPGLNMDMAMHQPAPRIHVRVGGARIDLELSRRQFLSYLFSYLVFTSFLLCVTIIVLNAVAPTIYLWRAEIVGNFDRGASMWLGLRLITVASLAALGSSVLITTLHGLFFLTERVHQPR